MLCDFHLHTSFSGDSDTPPEDQILKAAALNMPRICVTDHHDMDVVSDCDFTLDLPKYFPAMEALREQYRDQIRIEIGIELGLQNHIAQKLHETAVSYPFDFIIGSCHFIDGQDPYFPAFFQGKSEKEAYRRFFEVTLKRVEKLDCFDSLGHLDYVVRYGPAKNRYYDPKEYFDIIEPILRILVHRGKALECNTGGLHYGLGHPNPCEEILRRYRELGGELITVGSDAHVPSRLGYDFDYVRDLLKACGFSHYTVYHQRKPEFLPL